MPILPIVSSDSVNLQAEINKEFRDLSGKYGDNSLSAPDNTSALQEAIDRLKSLQSSARNQATATAIMSRGLSFSIIDPADWSKAYPYSLIILSLSNGKYIEQLRVTLPITPQELNVSIPFASTLTVTSRGRLEENNGAPIRNISFTASTGVFIKRPSFAQFSPDKSFVGTVFGGTISAVSQVGSAIRAVGGSNITSEQTKLSDDDAIYSGYYQYHLIRSALELYADLKMMPEAGPGVRLAIQMAKDNVTYLVTPQMFNIKKSASSPLEHIYTFQGIAWGTISPDQVQRGDFSDGPAVGSQSLVNDLGDYQRVLNAMRNMRGIVQRLKDVVTAVKTDIDVNLIGPVNNVIMALKEALSLPATIADLPNQIQKSLQQNVIKQAQQVVNQIPAELKGEFLKVTGLSTLGQVSGSFATATSSLTGSITSQNSFGVDVATKDKLLNNIDFSDSISVDSLQLTKAQQDAITTATVTALSINNNDIKDLAAQMQNTVDALEPVAVSQGDNSPVWSILYALQESQMEMFGLLSSNTFATTSTAQQQSGVTPLIQFYESTTAARNVNFVTPKSKMAIPFPFKMSLERLADQYLGDATRWVEIVAVNDLKPPYIDEDGFTYSFLSNGSGNQINISSIENLFVNQNVLVGSNTKLIEPRKILTIQQISDSNFLLTLDGESNMSDFKLSDQAFIKSFLPNTVNSQKMIYIPLDAPSNMDNSQTKLLPLLDVDPSLVKLSKVDLLLDDSGDLAVTSDGTMQLAFGSSNLIQAAKLKMSAIAGNVILHPSYGAGVEVGESIADVSVVDIKNRIIDSYKKDERYGAVKNILVTENEDAVEIGFTVPVAETGVELPLSFEIDQ